MYFIYNRNTTLQTTNVFEKICLLSALFVDISTVTGCDNRQGHEQKNSCESVSISVPETPPNWLTIIAAERGFFSKNSLDITTNYFPSGKRSLLGMFNGKVDIVAVAAEPIVFNSFKRRVFSCFAVIDSSSNYNKIVARKDSGISTSVNLIGKSVTTQKASSSHFFPHLFMLKNHNGNDEAENASSKVTIFTVTLPIKGGA